MPGLEYVKSKKKIKNSDAQYHHENIRLIDERLTITLNIHYSTPSTAIRGLCIMPVCCIILHSNKNIGGRNSQKNQ